MSTSAVPSTVTTVSPPRRTFRRRYSVARGNWYQIWGLISGSGLLALAAALGHNVVATVLMLVGLWVVYLNCHAIAHYAAGRLVGLRFRGYGVARTDHPEVYPPGIRQLMEAAPFYAALSTKESRERASSRAMPFYYVAGETSTAVWSIGYAAVATVANIPGASILLIVMIVFNAISTVVTTRNPNGDYGKALRALRS